jgi:hypothetical protein
MGRSRSDTCRTRRPGVTLTLDGGDLSATWGDDVSANPDDMTLQEYIAEKLVEGIRNLPGAGGFPILPGDEHAPDPRCALCGAHDSMHTLAACDRKMDAWEPTGLRQ